MRDRLIIFVRAPRLGAVKTRLAQEIGTKAALDVYERLVRAVLSQVAALPEVELRFTPDDAAVEVARWQEPGWQLHPQGPGDLGQRMHRAFVDAFRSGAERAALIGSDCPHLCRQDIEQAWSALEHADVVLGPAVDGGYWLIALRHPCPSLFQTMPWSTPDVLNETLARVRASGLRAHLLRRLRDIDTAADLRDGL